MFDQYALFEKITFSITLLSSLLPSGSFVVLPPRTTVSSDGHDEKQPSPPTILSSAADVVALTTSEGVEDDDETSSSDALPPPELLECDVEPPEQSEEAEARLPVVQPAGVRCEERQGSAQKILGMTTEAGSQLRRPRAAPAQPLDVSTEV
ncbi:unnamed protein product [Heligmosomoides polygyrus]|uniref:Uncharacterized protein n=1 Tax=Heligmosomoides polygyrus TaxID=6339 RepID=A0A183GAI5_HELPZ|nr:unnamed protein product [Heligmosomoides polygyrus]